MVYFCKKILYFHKKPVLTIAENFCYFFELEMRFSVPNLIAISVFVSSGFTSCQNASSNDRIMKEILSVISPQCTDVNCVAYRIDDSYPGDRKVEKGDSLHGYPIISAPIELSISNQRSLQSILGSKDTYINYEEPFDCSFLPGVAFRFDDSQSKVDLLICFTCSELRYYLNGKVGWQSYFNSVELKDLVKKLFPGDAKMQSLK